MVQSRHTQWLLLQFDVYTGRSELASDGTLGARVVTDLSCKLEGKH